MHPLDQQTILVTGATDGLGRALAQDLAARDATVLLHGRSADRLARATQEIRQATHNDRLRVYRADFASLEAVRGLAREIERDQPRLDRSEEHTSELQSPCNLVCRLLLEKKKKKRIKINILKRNDDVRNS